MKMDLYHDCWWLERYCRKPSAGLRGRIEKWKHVGGAADAQGRTVTEPIELMEAKVIDNICQRYSCLPSQLMDEDISLLQRIATVMEGESDGD